MPRQTWIFESDDKDGDFSDTGSHNTYRVGNVTDAVEAETEANNQGGEAIWFNGSIDPDTPYEVEAGQKFAIGEFDLDSQGVHYQPKGRGRGE